MKIVVIRKYILFNIEKYGNMEKQLFMILLQFYSIGISYRIMNIVKMSQLMRKLQSNGIIIKSLFYFLFILLFFYFALNLCIFKKTLYLSSFFFKRFFMYIKNFDYKNFFFWVIQNPCFFCTLLTIIFERVSLRFFGRVD